MELIGRMRSYFGGLLCVCWSPDSRLIATGGEDDLVTVWSFVEKRVIAKGRGHKSWVSVVAFDPYTTTLEGFDKSKQAPEDDESNDDEQSASSKPEKENSKGQPPKQPSSARNSDDQLCSNCTNSCSTSNCPNSSQKNGLINTYRLASVGQDTQLCFWEILEDDIIKQSIVKSRTSILSPNLSNHQSPNLNAAAAGAQATDAGQSASTGAKDKSSSNAVGSLKTGFLNLNLTNGLNSTSSSNSSNVSGSNKSTINASFHKSESKKEHKRNFSLNAKHHSEKGQKGQQQLNKTNQDPVKLLGTPICPRLEDVVKLDPLVCKKISHERLSSLTFCEDCFVVACTDVSTWIRPKYNDNCQSPSLLYDMIDELVNNENGSTVV